MRATSIIAAVTFLGMLATDAAAVELSSADLTMGVVDRDYEESSFVTRTHLGLRLRTGKSESGVSAEAAIGLHLDLVQDLTFQDNASSVSLRWQPATWGETEGLKLTLLPLTSWRMRLGYEYAATWARSIHGSAPAMDLRIERERWYAFGAVRLPWQRNQVTDESERLATWFAGGGFDLLPALRVEATAMHSDGGALPLTSTDMHEERSTGVGVSGRLLLHHGAPIGTSVDLGMYGNASELHERLFAPESYPEQVSFSLSIEAGNRSQRLAVPEVSGGIDIENAQILALQGRLKAGRLRVHALGMYRSGFFQALDSLGGFPRGFTLPEQSSTQSEVLFTGGVDYNFSGPGLTPGLVAAVHWPATATFSSLTFGGVNPPPTVREYNMIMGRDGMSLMLPGQTRHPILSAKANLRWDIAEVATLLAEASWTRDENRITFKDTAEGVAEPVAAPASIIGLAAMLQARF